MLNRLSEYVLFQWQLAQKLIKGKANSPLSTLITTQFMQERFDAEKDFPEIRQEIRKLRTNQESIEVIDLGAGSKKMGSRRLVSDMLKNSATTGKYGDLLYALPKILNCNSVLELGTNLGLGTHLLSMSHPKVLVNSVEGCKNTFSFTLKRLKGLKIPNIQLHEASFTDFIDNLKESDRFDFVFIDGHHDGAAMTNYFERLLPFLEKKSFVLLDDVRWSADMRSHTEKLKKHQSVADSCDFYRMLLLEIHLD